MLLKIVNIFDIKLACWNYCSETAGGKNCSDIFAQLYHSEARHRYGKIRIEFNTRKYEFILIILRDPMHGDLS